MDFKTIDAERVNAGISQYALCQIAGVHPTTYQRLLKGASGQIRTIARLHHGLKELLERKASEAA